jgi:hypothetical protein
VSLNLCVGTAEKYLFYIFNEPAISTCNETWRAKFEDEKHEVHRTIEIDGVSLYSLISNRFTSSPELLIVDAEGSDLDVLRSCHWHKLPKALWPLWIVCETSPPMSAAISSPHVTLLLDLGYEIQCILPMSTILKLDASKFL